MFEKTLFKHPEILNFKPKIGLSQCLLGDNVRYNAKTKRHTLICDILKDYADLIPICPEVGAGLTTPRPAVQLIRKDHNVIMQGVDNVELDITQAVKKFSLQIINQYPHVFHAFIFKARSPSCGLKSSPVFNNTGHQIDIASGLFAQTALEHWNDCIFLQEEDINSEAHCMQLLLDCYLLMDKQWPQIKNGH